MKVNQLIYLLFIFFIVTLPINAIGDTIAFFYSLSLIENKTIPQTPIIFKLFKDFFLCMVILLIAYRGGFRYVNRSILPFYIVLGCIIGFALLSLMNTSFVIILLGVRSYLSIFFVIFGFLYYDFDSKQFYPALKILLVFEVILQIFQFFIAPGHYSSQFMGFNLANPGTFLIPSTMAAFAILVFYYAKQSNDKVTMAIAIFAILLSRSSTALLVIIAYHSIVAARSLRLSFGVISTISAMLMVLVFLNIDAITGRENIIQNLFTRFEIFRDALTYPLGKGFGLGSASAVLMQVDGSVIADSALASLVLNLGWAGFLIYLFFVFKSAQNFHYTNLLLISFIAFSLTMVIFEMTPFIQFYFFELGKAIRLKNENAGSDAHLMTS